MSNYPPGDADADPDDDAPPSLEDIYANAARMDELATSLTSHLLAVRAPWSASEQETARMVLTWRRSSIELLRWLRHHTAPRDRPYPHDLRRLHQKKPQKKGQPL